MSDDTTTHGPMNTDPTPHPSDEQLFDHVEGKLRRGHSQEVAQHIASCATCAALVAQAAAGNVRAAATDAGVAIVEPLPPAAAEQLHAAIGAEWSRRTTSAAQHSGWSRLPVWRRNLNLGLALGVVAAVLGVAVAQVDNLSSNDESAMNAPAPEMAGSPAVAPADNAAKAQDQDRAAAGGAKADSGADLRREEATNDSLSGAGVGAEAVVPPLPNAATGATSTVTTTGTVQPPPPCLLRVGKLLLVVAAPTQSPQPGLAGFGPITSISLTCPTTAGSGSAAVGSVPPGSQR